MSIWEVLGKMTCIGLFFIASYYGAIYISSMIMNYINRRKERELEFDMLRARVIHMEKANERRDERISSLEKYKRYTELNDE